MTNYFFFDVPINKIQESVYLCIKPQVWKLSDKRVRLMRNEAKPLFGRVVYIYTTYIISKSIT